MLVPTANDLLSQRFLRPPKTASGIFVDRDQGNDLHMRFMWATPDKWLWMHKREPPSGAITDGNTNTIIEEGSAVIVTHHGKVVTSNRLRNFFRPGSFDYSGWKLSSVSPGTVLGREAWITSAMPTAGNKLAHDLAFDAESGILLFMRSQDFYTGFEELSLNEEVGTETFEWSGPIHPRKFGDALVIPESDNTYSAIWEVSVRDRPMFFQKGPSGVQKAEAIAWAEQRAAEVRIREQ